MRREELIDLVKGTSDPAYVLDPSGGIAAWNGAAETFFGVSAGDALGRHCSEVLHGVDECGRECELDCSVKKHTLKFKPMKSYDVRVDTANGRRWCSMSVTMAGRSGTAAGYTLHIARSSDLQKRMEGILRDFMLRETSLSAANIEELTSIKSSTTQVADLTKREVDVVRLLAKGRSTAQIAKELFISAATVNNHVQRILKKLSAHSRLEAVRRAEKARLI